MGFSPSIHTLVTGRRFLWWRPHSLQLSVSIIVTWISEAWSLTVFTNTCISLFGCFSFFPLATDFIVWIFATIILLLNRFSRVRFCATPETVAHQAPPSLGLSRQEHWSGLPFPSPMHESEKWKWSRSVVSDSSRPHGLQPSRLLRPWDFPGKSTGVGCHCLLQLLFYTLLISSKTLCSILLGHLTLRFIFISIK